MLASNSGRHRFRLETAIRTKLPLLQLDIRGVACLPTNSAPLSRQVGPVGRSYRKLVASLLSQSKPANSRYPSKSCPSLQPYSRPAKPKQAISQWEPLQVPWEPNSNSHLQHRCCWSACWFYRAVVFSNDTSRRIGSRLHAKWPPSQK
jgi:hypothetical protein